MLDPDSTMADFETVACNAGQWPIESDIVQVPVLMFDVSKSTQWKFTPQCDIYPIAKSMCLTKFREDWTHHNTLCPSIFMRACKYRCVDMVLNMVCFGYA